jgi:glycosyltransferase involved in cell wall biosynthesis
MARLGVNPARGKTSTYQPARVTVAVLTYLPHLEGYFRHKLDVLRLSLTSILAHTTPEYDLLVFDNGSCAPVVDELRSLHAAGKIDYLVLSARNLGKIGAFKVMFQAAPGEIVAYSDDDIFFYPGWLEAALEILAVYPRVGMVSGVPVRDAAERARQSLEAWIGQKPAALIVSSEHRIPDDWEADWAMSTGREPRAHLARIQNQPDLTLEFRGVKAFGSASHFQFVAPKEVLLRALPEEWSGQLMGQMLALDEAIDAQGYLRLSTVERYTRHVGNLLNPEIVAEARQLGLEASATGVSSATTRKHWLLRIPGSGRVLRKIYDQIFLVLNR